MHITWEKMHMKISRMRLEPGCKTVEFHEKLPKLKLKTFKDITKYKKVVQSEGKAVILRADRNLFAHIILLSHSRKLSMEDVLQHPLGPLPWSLVTNDGLLRKTNKAVLRQGLDKNFEPAEKVPSPSACLIDGMALIQKLKVDHMTFGEISDVAFNRVLSEGAQSLRIDVVFDVYRNLSIKQAERVRRGAGTAIQFNNISAGHNVRQFSKFLKDGENKNKLIEFFAKQWIKAEKRRKLNNKLLYFTCSNRCFKVTTRSVEEADELKSEQEEADTRIILHAAHVPKETYKAIILVCEDTDVFILGLAYSFEVSVPMYQKCLSQTRTRFIDLRKISASLGEGICTALLGMHAFTGYDTVSAFSGKGKMKPLNMLRTSTDFHPVFQKLGSDWSISDDLVKKLQAFVCIMYGAKKGIEKINQFRYQLFCSKKGEIESHLLPPCEDCLKQHCERANYQTAIWKNSIQNGMVPSPIGRGWVLDKTGEEEYLNIDWMHGLPAPQAVIKLLSCSCKKSCTPEKCPCKQNDMKCTNLCSLVTCDNQVVTEEDECAMIYDEEESDSEMW